MLKNAKNFLNCSVIVFSSKECYQYGNDEIADFMGVSSDTVRGILESSRRKIIKKVNSDEGKEFRDILKQRWKSLSHRKE